MSIPEIENYSLNAPELSAVNVVKWEHESRRSVLLVHDMQRYFLKAFPLSLRTKLIEHCRELISYARAHGIPVVYTAQRGDMTDKERGLLFDIWGKGMSSAAEHTAIAEELAPQAGETVLAKWRYSAFHATSFDDIFREYKRDQIVICGVFAHIGILASAVDAYSRDIEVFLVQDAIADFSMEKHAQALHYAAECCARVLPTRELLK